MLARGKPRVLDPRRLDIRVLVRVGSAVEVEVELLESRGTHVVCDGGDNATFTTAVCRICLDVLARYHHYYYYLLGLGTNDFAAAWRVIHAIDIMRRRRPLAGRRVVVGV